MITALTFWNYSIKCKLLTCWWIYGGKEFIVIHRGILELELPYAIRLLGSYLMSYSQIFWFDEMLWILPKLTFGDKKWWYSFNKKSEEL